MFALENDDDTPATSKEVSSSAVTAGMVAAPAGLRRRRKQKIGVNSSGGVPTARFLPSELERQYIMDGAAGEVTVKRTIAAPAPIRQRDVMNDLQVYLQLFYFPPSEVLKRRIISSVVAGGMVLLVLVRSVMLPHADTNVWLT